MKTLICYSCMQSYLTLILWFVFFHMTFYHLFFSFLYVFISPTPAFLFFFFLLINHHCRPDGITFEIGPQNIKCDDKPKLGDIVTFAYENYTRKAVPVEPKVYQIRRDLSWKDVIFSYKQQLHKSQHLNGKLTSFYYLFAILISVLINRIRCHK